jgi:hypothetical protein
MTDKEKLQIAIAALKQCTRPSGAYNQNRLTHAMNCIQNVGDIAKKALDEIGVDYSNVEIEQ